MVNTKLGPGVHSEAPMEGELQDYEKTKVIHKSTSVISLAHDNKQINKMKNTYAAKLCIKTPDYETINLHVYQKIRLNLCYMECEEWNVRINDAIEDINNIKYFPAHFGKYYTTRNEQEGGYIDFL